MVFIVHSVLQLQKLVTSKNPYANSIKKQITIRLDEDTIDYFKNMSEEVGISYQNLINLYLLEEENALKEIVQEIILFALWQADFFEVAAFQGGTSLRVLHGLTRFSEDIDFILLKPAPHFKWQPYLNKLIQGMP